MAKENAKKRNVRRNFFILGRFIVALLTIFACRCYDMDIERKRWKNRQLISKGKKRERTWFLMKKLLAFLLVAVMAMGLCSVASAEGYDQALIDAAKAEGELTVYGSCEEAYLNAACDKFQELFGITVNRQRLSTGEVAAKIEEENGNPSADVWFGGTTDPYNESVAKGLLEPYEAKNASHLLGDMYRDKDGCWYGIYKGILGFMCNTEELERLGLEPQKYMLLSAHREENIDTEQNFIDLFTSINHLAETYDMPILYSCHPRSKKRLDAMGFKLDERVKLHEPLGFHDYNHLQMNAFAVISDSGTLPEESSFFTSVGHPFPAVCIRTSTERPEALDKGCFVLAGIRAGGVEQAVETAVAMNANHDYGIPVPYYTEDVSTKVVKIIQSYTGVVNKMVWRKN